MSIFEVLNVGFHLRNEINQRFWIRNFKNYDQLCSGPCVYIYSLLVLHLSSPRLCVAIHLWFFFGSLFIYYFGFGCRSSMISDSRFELSFRAGAAILRQSKNTAHVDISEWNLGFLKAFEAQNFENENFRLSAGKFRILVSSSDFEQAQPYFTRSKIMLIISFLNQNSDFRKHLESLISNFKSQNWAQAVKQETSIFRF